MQKSQATPHVCEWSRRNWKVISDREIWKDDASNDTICAVAAPTGLAAYNVGGVTVHGLFQLPIEHEGKTAGY